MVKEKTDNKEIENKRKWLWRYREAMFQAQSLWRQAEEWKYAIYEPSCKVLDGMPKSPGFSNNFDKNVVKHLDLIEEATVATAQAKDIRKEITASINSLDDSVGVKVLTLRYVEGCSWNEIQKAMNYSKTHTRNLHDKALMKLKIGQNSAK